MAQAEYDSGLTANTDEPIGSRSASIANPLLAPDHCVICLDVISDKAIALPCNHEQFDFPCLGTWLQRQQVCPLCKGLVTALRFNVTDTGGENESRIFYLPAQEATPPRSGSDTVRSFGGDRRATQESVIWRRDRERLSAGPYRRRRRDRSHTQPSADITRESALSVRRHVYRQSLYSLHVGSNRISRYRTLTPSMFQNDAHLISRARMFIRRELQVFDFLNPDDSSDTSSARASSSTNSTGSKSTDRRANNADFLLEYIVSILKSIDLKGSSGQAEELLTDFLGRPNAKLFIHEFGSWLRSPYERLEHWDRNVQYAMPSSTKPHEHREREGGQHNTCEGPLSDDGNVDRVPRWFSERFVLDTTSSGRRVTEPP